MTDIWRNIPRDKGYPSSAGQCDTCGGLGCDVCAERGWLAPGHPRTRRSICGRALSPRSVAAYCSVECAARDA
jgi:hypothetical protein